MFVNHRVFLQCFVGLCREIAFLTLESFHTRMREHVFPEGCRLNECHIACATFMRSFARVRAHVNCVRVTMVRCVGADRTLDSGWRNVVDSENEMK